MGDTGPSSAGVIGCDDLALESLCCYHDNYTQLSGDPPVSPPDSMSNVVWRECPYTYILYTSHVVRYTEQNGTPIDFPVPPTSGDAVISLFFSASC